MTATRHENDTGLFLARWLRSPRHIGAIAPSSRFLGRAMARLIDLDSDLPVVELGGGTGSITRALLAAGLPPRRLIVVERDEALHQLLSARFPGVTVLKGDAAELVALLRGQGVHEAAAVISGLPLLAMPKPVRERIADQCFALLGSERPLLQFTYGLVSPLPFAECRVKGHVATRVWRNLPPAAVWRYTRPAAA